MSPRKRLPGVGSDLLARLGFADEATAALREEVGTLRANAATASKQIEALTRALRSMQRSMPAAAARPARLVRTKQAGVGKRGTRG